MNYSDIIVEAKRQADKHDDDVDASMDNMILMLEADINRELRTSESSRTGALVGVDDKNYYPLPNDFNGMRTLRVNGAVYEFDIPERAIGSIETVYTLVGDQLYLSVVKAGDSVEMVYYQNLEGITTDIPSNWISRIHPDVYIDGLVYQIEKFVKNYDTANKRYELFMNHINKINHGDQLTRWSGTPLQVKAGL